MKRMVFLTGDLPDPIAVKRLELFKKEFDLTLIYWKKVSTKKTFIQTGYSIKELCFEANPTNPLKRIWPYKKFQSATIKELNRISPDLIYAQALDMLMIASRYKDKNRSVRIVYEVADLHRYIIDKPRNVFMSFVRSYLIHQDKKNEKNYDALVVTSEKYYDIYFRDFVSPKKVVFIPNMPNNAVFSSYRPKLHKKPYTIGFIGGIRYINQIKNLLVAAKETGWNVLLAGNENGEEIKNIARDMSNVEYMGRFDFDTQIVSIYEKCDVIYSVYDADMINVRVALPNKLYESIICELPIIVANNTYLAEMVNKLGVGVSVDYRGYNELEKVLYELAENDDYYNSMIEQCKKQKCIIDLEQYNSELLNRINAF